MYFEYLVKVNGHVATERVDRHAIIKKLFDNINGKTDSERLKNIEVQHINQRLEDFGLNGLKFNHLVSNGILSFKKDKQIIDAYQLPMGDKLIIKAILIELAISNGCSDNEGDKLLNCEFKTFPNTIFETPQDLIDYINIL